jgi:cell division protein ZapE
MQVSVVTPLDYYHEQVESGAIASDPEQLSVMQHFDRVQRDLLVEREKRSGIFSLFHKNKTVRGIYIWGGVGIGKTFMMDCFYHTLPFENKMRMHFHQFMHLVHEKLTVHQGENDPLQVIARELAQQTAVLCFDELFVSDITDAMLLGRLFKALFLNGVCLIATSNVKPDDLYKNGLQRSQFLPAIALLKQELDVIHVPSVMDYRLRHLQEAGVFYIPLNKDNEKRMTKSFDVLTQGEKIENTPVFIQGRSIKVVKRTNDVIWFEFKDICKVPRSQNDYLALTHTYRTIFISNIPAIEANEKDTICLFISLVDVLYDARMRLVISAAEPVDQLYNRGYMIMEYSRTNSRLLEMQSQDYFSDDFDRRR